MKAIEIRKLAEATKESERYWYEQKNKECFKERNIRTNHIRNMVHNSSGNSEQVSIII
jgi:hypothetical protein